MATAATPAATSAAASAAPPFFDPVDAVNTATGYPVTPRYPGALDAEQYSAPEADEGFPTTPGGPGEPTQSEGQPFAAGLPHIAQGGGYADFASASGHDGPQVAWDSSAGGAFAPSAAVNPELHGTDTGGVFNREYVVPAAIGSLTRRSSPGQTTVRNGSGDQVTKDNVTAPNDRTNLDEYQNWNPDGYDPWEIPYSERPVLNNVAWEATAIDPTGMPYTPSGSLPDRSVYNEYPAMAYDAPPDPYVSSGAAAAGSPGIGGGWV
jgi:hypothetical protein